MDDLMAAIIVLSPASLAICWELLRFLQTQGKHCQPDQLAPLFWQHFDFLVKQSVFGADLAVDSIGSGQRYQYLDTDIQAAA